MKMRSVNIKNNKGQIYKAYQTGVKLLLEDDQNVTYAKVSVEHNTKKEIYEAYQKVKKLLKEKRIDFVNIELVNEVIKQETLPKKETTMPKNILLKMDALTLEIAEALNQVKIDRKKKIDRYTNIQEKITKKEAELKEIFGISKEEFTLSAVRTLTNSLEIETNNHIKDILNQSKKRQEAIKEEINTITTNFEKGLKERQAELLLIEERGQEEYVYNLNREKFLFKEELKAKKESLELELKDRIEKIKKPVVDEKEKLKRIENDLGERERVRIDLQKQAETQNKEIAKIKADVTQKIKNKLEGSYKYKESHLTKTFKAQTSMLENEKNSFKVIIADLKNKIDTLTNKLEFAYEKIQSIALKSAESSANANIVSKMEKIIENQQNTHAKNSASK